MDVKKRQLFGSYLRRLREAKKLSLTDMVRLTGLSGATFSRVENAERRPTPVTLQQMAPANGVKYQDLHDMLWGSEPIPADHPDSHTVSIGPVSAEQDNWDRLAKMLRDDGLTEDELRIVQMIRDGSLERQAKPREEEDADHEQSRAGYPPA